MLRTLKKLYSEERGQGLAEYGLILALVSLVVVVALGLLGGGLNGIFGRVNDQLGTATSTTSE